MAYRNGTYIAFHAAGTTDPTASDIRYYRLLKAWHEHDDIDFTFINSHDKAASVRDSSKKATLMESLRQRLNNSKNMVLILGQTTKYDTDWVPFEIEHAVDRCRIPLIVTYTDYSSICDPAALSMLWPTALSGRIAAQTVKAVHVPFKQQILDDAIRRFNLTSLPDGSLVHYTREGHRRFGVDVPF